MTIAAHPARQGQRGRRPSRATTAGRDAVAVLGEQRIGALPVVEGGEIAGIMSERDVIYCLRERWRRRCSTGRSSG